MGIRSVALACALSLVGASAASAANHGWYASAELGTDTADYWAAAAIGHHFGDNFSLELAASGGGDSLNQVLLNANLSYPITDVLSIVGGAGAGIAHMSVHNVGDGVFAYQLFFGLDYELSETTTVYARYRSVTAKDISYDWWSDDYVDATSGVMAVGLRFDF